ncbi:MAG: hypothetical protein RMJ43_15810 [Chloroherpetonaceae bacterium]|nr:hypothetical protein [Chthonomonadaceae bacterium]MDW8209300.1 hypothetical protein [Chloroherpetonaceae bacterium]
MLCARPSVRCTGGRTGMRGGADAMFWLVLLDRGARVLHRPLTYQGKCWRSHWWVADFSELRQPGEYMLLLEGPGTPDAGGWVSGLVHLRQVMLWS